LIAVKSAKLSTLKFLFRSGCYFFYVYVYSTVCVAPGREKTVLEMQNDDRNYVSSLGRYVFGSEISYNKPPPRLPGLAC
jgi:hypothetical protein